VHLALTTALHQRDALRDGLDPATAADALYALASPHVHQLLRRHRRWPVEQYAAWIENAAIRELLPGREPSETVRRPKTAPT
jgi:hypothetical protein